MRDRSDKLRESAEKILEMARKALQAAGFHAGQYKELAQKKYDLNILHKNIVSLHADIGKIVDNCWRCGDKDILSRDDVRSILRRLDSYKIAAAEMEEEIERIKIKMPPDITREKTD